MICPTSKENDANGQKINIQGVSHEIEMTVDPC
jgi:hypothetical protein